MSSPRHSFNVRPSVALLAIWSTGIACAHRWFNSEFVAYGLLEQIVYRPITLFNSVVTAQE